MALLGGLINCVSEHRGVSREGFHEGSEAMSPPKPGLSRRGDSSASLLIPQEWC